MNILELDNIKQHKDAISTRTAITMTLILDLDKSGILDIDDLKL